MSLLNHWDGSPKDGNSFPKKEDIPIRILVVEDSSDHSELLVRQLRKAQLNEHVKIISDGKSAWRFLSSNGDCDNLIAIFLDLDLPCISGMELLQKIRNHPKLAGLPVIIVTASDDIHDRAKCRSLKATAIVEKPVTFSTFSKIVADVFHPRQQQAQTNHSE